jgi:hypothetical protein
VTRLFWIPAVALVGFGVEGMYHALRGREKVAIDCVDLTRATPASHNLLVTGCEIDFAGSGYRESGGQIAEIFLPARPAGRTVAAPLVVATREPEALALARSAFAGRTPTPDQSIEAMRKIAARIHVTSAIDGLARAGTIERWRSRRILSGLAAPLSDNALLVDFKGAPDFLTPLLALGSGLLFALLPFALRAARRPAAVEPPPAPSPDPLPPFERFPPVPVPLTVTLPRMLLLNLDVSSGPEAIETADALGTRPDVIAILRGVIPDLELDVSGRFLARPDGSIRLDLGSQDHIATAVVEARGEAGVALVKEILLMTGWRAFAPKTGLFVTVEELTALGALAQ